MISNIIITSISMTSSSSSSSIHEYDSDHNTMNTTTYSSNMNNRLSILRHDTSIISGLNQVQRFGRLGSARRIGRGKGLVDSI